MSTEGLLQIINSSLADLKITPFPIHKDNSETNNDTNGDDLIDFVFNENELDTMINSTFMKSFYPKCNHENNPMKPLITINEEHSKIIKHEISKCIHEFNDTEDDNSNVIPLIDFRLVSKGLKKSHQTPIKFIDQNEKTLPTWTRKENIFKKETMIVKNQNDDKDTEVIDLVDNEIEFRSLRDVSDLCILTTNDDFWNNIKSEIREHEHELEILNHEHEHEKKINDVLEKYQKTIHVTSEHWTEKNPNIIDMIEKTKHENKKHHVCGWQKFNDIISSKMTKSFSMQSSLKTNDVFDDQDIQNTKKIIDKMIKDYLKLTHQTNIFFTKNELSNFFFHNLKIRFISDINQRHFNYASKNTKISKKCDVCHQLMNQGNYHYLILFCSQIYIKMKKIDYPIKIQEKINCI